MHGLILHHAVNDLVRLKDLGVELPNEGECLLFNSLLKVV